VEHRLLRRGRERELILVASSCLPLGLVEVLDIDVGPIGGDAAGSVVRKIAPVHIAA